MASDAISRPSSSDNTEDTSDSLMPKQRRGLHPDNNIGLHQEASEELKRCKKCENKFIISKDGVLQTKLDGKEDLDKWCELQKKKGDKETDLQNLAIFTCKGCSPPGLGWNNGKWIIPAIFKLAAVIVLCCCCYCCFVYMEDILYSITRGKEIPVKNEVQSAAERMLEQELLSIEKAYDNQIVDTWISLASGIKSVMMDKPNQPSTFLMLFDSESAGETARCIAQDVSKPAIKYLMKKSGTPMILNGAELNKASFSNDPGLLLTHLNGTVREKGALLVTNLHKVPPEVAKMFHYVCDKYSPLVEKAVTFFTLKVDELPSQKNQQKIADETMRKLWSSVLEDHLLRPLITRMASNIIRIYPDSSCSVI